ncbi:MAG: YceI family protein [Elusimicrobia bacterium]|nr:YceI family protein [Elusimicrobiota bacterium]
MRKKMLQILVLAAVLPAPQLWAMTYHIDPMHSSVSFRIRHLVGKVSGNFKAFFGFFDYEEDKPEAWRVEAMISTASIDTRVEQRDGDLRGAKFFNAEKFSDMRFVSTKVADFADDTAKLHGDLTLLGVTKPVVLDLQILGMDKDPQGMQRVGAMATGKINRKDFGMVWNEKLDRGGYLLGDEVEITLEVEGVSGPPLPAMPGEAPRALGEASPPPGEAPPVPGEGLPLPGPESIKPPEAASPPVP